MIVVRFMVFSHFISLQFRGSTGRRPLSHLGFKQAFFMGRQRSWEFLHRLP